MTKDQSYAAWQQAKGMDPQFTSGPWEACDPGDYGDFDGDSRVILGNDMRIAVVHWHDGDCRAENDANANLIAAAPELYSVVVDLFENPIFQVSIGSSPIRIEELVGRARAALAKARAFPHHPTRTPA